MGAPLKIVPAATVSLEAFAAAFTDAFRGYYHTVSHDGASLARRVRLEQYDLANSLLAYDGREVVGVAALAVRGRRGWCAGFGIVPGSRGRGRGRGLMSALVARAREAGLRRLSLEVMAPNVAARRLYEWAGMSVTRDLLVLERAAARAGDEAAARGASITPRRARAAGEASAEELLAHYWRLHAEPPAWQRELASLLAADLRGLYFGPRARPRAYALTGRAPDGNTYVSDLAAAGAAEAEELCAALARTPGALRVVNEPEQSPFAAPLLRHGFAEVTRQHEMTMEL
ncbi:MAG: GNAT family N-acetyltransferase [Acidobacteria bacterium]|nr:GNAT family N-acetyltransferase [Acidobacteriota bacterium]